MSLDKELALIDVGYACFTIPKFHGQEEEFTGWLTKVERVFACCILNDQEKFKVVISRLRGCALQWWQNYKFKRRKKGKEKVRTWKKLSCKMKGFFCPSTYTPMIESISIKPTAPLSPSPQKNQTPQKGLPPQLTPKPLPRNIPKCFKCQGFGHLESDCTNRRFVTLAEWKATEEVELEEEKGEEVENHDGDDFEEVVIEANEGEMLAMDTHLPPRSHEHLSLPTTFYEPQALSPVPPTPKTLNKNFCQSISEPLLKAPNSHLRAYEDVVLNMFKKSPMRNFQISKGNEKKRVPKVKRDLFSWLILFQPEMKQNPSLPHVHTSITPLHQIPKQFPMKDERETDFEIKPSLFEWLILFQPSSLSLVLRQ